MYVGGAIHIPDTRIPSTATYLVRWTTLQHILHCCRDKEVFTKLVKDWNGSYPAKLLALTTSLLLKLGSWERPHGLRRNLQIVPLKHTKVALKMFIVIGQAN